LIREVKVREKKEKNTSHRDAELPEGKRRLFGLLGFVGLFGFVGFIEDKESNEAKRPTVNR